MAFSNSIMIIVALMLAMFSMLVAADNLSISSVKYARQEFKVAGTANMQGSKLTLYSCDSKGNNIAPIMYNDMPMTAEVYGCINSACQFEFQVRGRGVPSKSNYVMVKSDKGGVAGPYMVA